MTKVVIGATMSLDGFIADRNGDATPLYPDLSDFRDNGLIAESIESTGAVVMGRGAYDVAEGDFAGYEYRVPIFVLTHRPPDEAAGGESESGLAFHFVTDGPEAAVARAKAAAGEGDVTVVGGADIFQQCVRSGLFDEIHVALVPVLLREGLRLFEEGDGEPIELERERVVETRWAGHEDVTYLEFGVAT